MPTPRAARHQRGVTMIEVMIAILVLSIGLLGVAATLAKGARFALGAWSQASVATGLSDMAERLRASPNAVVANFSLEDDYATQRAAIDAGEVTSAKDCDSEACTPEEAAGFHLTTWRLALDRSLPGAAGWVRPLSSAATEPKATAFELVVMWFDKSNLDSDDVLNAAAVCAGSETGLDQRRCCPAEADAADGVRCTRMVLVP